MRRLLRATTVVAVFLVTAASGAAQTPADFYLNLLRRGIGEFDAGRYDTAISQLRIAAFGLIDSTDRYQFAHVYMAIAADRLSRPADASAAANRVMAAERVKKTFTSLSLPPPVRSSFDAIAKKALTAGDYAALTAPMPATAQQRPANLPPIAEKPKPPLETKPAAPPEQKPAPQQPKTNPAPAPEKKSEPKRTPAQLDAAIVAAEKSLSSSDLSNARRSFRALLDQQLSHAQLLRVAEGLYRAHDFAHVIRAFDRAGALRRGEEPYRYYLAVALYETGKRDAAKKELAAVLPFIEITSNVEQYRRKIEGSAQ